MLKKLGVPEGKVQQLFKKGGQVLIKNKPEVCPTCGGSGYFGQDGVFEVYAITKEERDLIAQGNYQGLKAALRKKSLPSLQQVAIRKAVDGITSVEEVMRVTASEAPAAAGAGTPASPAAAV
jgi:type II secretory ATPase GspE/PulE/Tfp pilus assembly ATPase PilB-like protein